MFDIEMLSTCCCGSSFLLSTLHSLRRKDGLGRGSGQAAIRGRLPLEELTEQMMADRQPTDRPATLCLQRTHVH